MNSYANCCGFTSWCCSEQRQISLSYDIYLSIYLFTFVTIYSWFIVFLKTVYMFAQLYYCSWVFHKLFSVVHLCFPEFLWLLSYCTFGFTETLSYVKLFFTCVNLSTGILSEVFFEVGSLRWTWFGCLVFLGVLYSIHENFRWCLIDKNRALIARWCLLHYLITAKSFMIAGSWDFYLDFFSWGLLVLVILLGDLVPVWSWWFTLRLSLFRKENLH